MSTPTTAVQKIDGTSQPITKRLGSVTIIRSEEEQKKKKKKKKKTL
jgi:hypothetical protein